MVFFIQRRKLETVVQDPGGDTLFCPQGTMPGGYIVTPQSPPEDTKGEGLSQLSSWSCTLILRHCKRSWPYRASIRAQGRPLGAAQLSSGSLDIVSASLHPGVSSISSPRALICST